MLNNEQISLVKGLLDVGYRQHDIAAHFGVNAGRIGEIKSGVIGAHIKAATENLPDVRPVGYLNQFDSVKNQIKIFDDLRLRKHMDVARIHVFSPELCAHILENLNRANRKPSASRIASYADAMNRNLWPVTGATIVFGKSGYLLDGQHRLMAAVHANKALKTYAVFGIDDQSFLVMDIGRKRTNSDAFQTAGIKKPETTSRAVRWLMIFEQDPYDRGKSFENSVLHEFYATSIDKNLLARCVEYATEIHNRRKRYLPAGSLAALLYVFIKKTNTKTVEQFVQLFVDDKSYARSVCSAIANRTDNNAGRLHEVVRNALLIQAWNAFRAGGRVSKSIFNWTLGDQYPDVK